MPRHHALTALVLSLTLGLPIVSRQAVAQEWATKMFSETSHSFGTVARGAKVEYLFQFNNPYKEAVHVVSVSSSCGCTTPEVVKNDVATYEKSAILAKFNTRSFTGYHAATLTVTIDRPYYATVQLNVSGEIRGDIEVKSADPGTDSGVVDFGTVSQGELRERKMTVVRYGRSDWQIVDVRSVNTNYEVEVVDGARSPGRVSYELVVRLKKDATPGYIHDPLILMTNDPQVAQVPIEVEGMIKSQFTVSPQVLAMGTVEAGQQVTKPLIVNGQKPFKIVAVHCDDNSFSFKIPAGEKKVRIIPVTFSAPNKPGRLVKKITIQTDSGNAITLEVLAQVQVIGAPAAPAVTPKAIDDSTAPAKTSGPADAAPLEVLKLDAGPDNTSSGTPAATRPTDAKPIDSKPADVTPAKTKPADDNIDAPSTGNPPSAGQSVAPTVTKPTSVMPNPIRAKAPIASSGNSAAVN